MLNMGAIIFKIIIIVYFLWCKTSLMKVYFFLLQTMLCKQSKFQLDQKLNNKKNSNAIY